MKKNRSVVQSFKGINLFVDDPARKATISCYIVSLFAAAAAAAVPTNPSRARQRQRRPTACPRKHAPIFLLHNPSKS